MIGEVRGTLNASGKDGGGNIDILFSDNLTITDTARLLAESTNSGKGGRVFITNAIGGFGLTIDQGGFINVSGAEGGGRVEIDSDDDLHVSGDIKADAKKTGNGGSILLTSDLGLTTLTSDISARGGSQAGNGGDVTIWVPNIVTGTVDVSAPNGNDGTFTH